MHFTTFTFLALSLLTLATARPHPQTPMANPKACNQAKSAAAIVFNDDTSNPKCVVIGTASDLSSNPISADKIAIANISEGKDASAKDVDPKKVVCTVKKNNSSNKAGELTVAQGVDFEKTTKITAIECDAAA